MKIKTLTLREAYDLYVLLNPVFPKYDENTSILDFLYDYITSIDEAMLWEVFELFLGEETGKIQDMERVDILSLLVDCFETNRITELMSFFDGLIHE